MKGRTVVKVLLDVVMTVLYILLMFGYRTGEFFHEAAGIGIGALFAAHVALNWKQVKGLWKQAKKGKLKITQGVSLISDCLLTLGMAVVIVTGILISRQLFTFDTGNLWLAAYNIHSAVSYVCLGILAAHLALHAKYLYAVIKQILRKRKEKSVKRVLSGFAAAAFAVCVIYSYFQSALRYTGSLSISEAKSSEVSKASDTADTQSTEQYAVEASDKTTTQSSTKSEEDDKKSAATTVQNADVPTLSEFLGKLFCSGCPRMCPLSNPQCGKSASYIEEAKLEYNDLYAIVGE